MGGTALGQTMRVIAVAKELQRNGHEVKVLAGEKQIPILQSQQLDFLAMPSLPEFDSPFKALLGTDDKAREEIMTRIKEMMRPIAEAEQAIIWREKPDVLLCGNLTGPSSAQTYNIPCVMVILQPHGRKTIELFTRRLPTQAQNLNILKAVNLLIMEGMPELDGGASAEFQGEWAEVIKDKLRFTGPLLVEAPESLPSREELKLRHAGNKDRPLIYVTIGGGTPLIGEDFLALVLNAFRSLPDISVVIATGLALEPEQLAGYNPPKNVFIRGFVPGSELIKASDVTVFHGGSSTLMTCLACGTPAVVVPSMAEQEDNGAVLAQNGAGIVLDKSDLIPSALTEAVQKILSDPSFRNNAQRLKALGEKYGGASAAAILVEQLAGRERLP
jgi:UDP:flavonoid glycosyltransferase YjiC (YdhE family)